MVEAELLLEVPLLVQQLPQLAAQRHRALNRLVLLALLLSRQQLANNKLKAAGRAYLVRWLLPLRETPAGDL